MEKRNFVTSCRTSEASKNDDELVDSAASLFGSKAKNASEYEKRASAEDEKTDSAD